MVDKKKKEETKSKKQSVKTEAKSKGAKQDAKGKSKEKVKAQSLKFDSVFMKKYQDECVPQLVEKFSYKNKMKIPKLLKIVVNTCTKDAVTDSKILGTVVSELTAITGQKVVITKAKKSISNFKLREGMPIGARVTLRNKSMYEFMNRLVNIALPRVRDFRGVSPKGFDGNGNYTMGITEQTIFPEIDFDKVHRVNGMNITFVTSAKTNEEGKELLRLFGMPFRGKSNN